MKVRHMKKFLFSSRTTRMLVLAGAVALIPASAASAATTSIFATAQGTSLLGTEIPVLGTQGWTLTVPVKSTVAPEFVWNALDFTVTSEATVGGFQVYNLYVDPRMAN
jgi:hypothetical protein